MTKYISGVIGVILAGGSAFELWSLMQPTIPPHIPDRHLVYLFAIGVFFGALLIIPTIIVTTLKSLFGVIGPYIPMIGGRRITDPPAPPPSAIPPKSDQEGA